MWFELINYYNQLLLLTFIFIYVAIYIARTGILNSVWIINNLFILHILFVCIY